MLTRMGMVMVGAVVMMASTMWGARVWAADESHAGGEHEMKAQMPAPPPPSPLLERFRALQGEWEGTPSQHEEGMPEKYVVTYRTTSGGSAVVETFFPGTDHEMVSVYYADGDQIVMTHYCILGNQPRMTVRPGSDTSTLEFVCQGGGNLEDENVPHMHAATYRFIDDEHMQVSGTLSSQGKTELCGIVDYHRVVNTSVPAGKP
jgi:hypothetical protein